MIDTAQRPSRWWALRSITVAVACLFAIVAGAAPAAAHASLVSTDPVEGAVLAESPGEVTFTFNEPVALPADGVQVFDAEGEPVESSASSEDLVVTVDVPDELPDGSYVVVWRVVSADGHPVAGALTFSVGKPSLRVVSPDLPGKSGAAVTTAISVAHAATYLGLLLAVGLSIFAVLLVPSSVQAERPRQRMRTLTALAAIVALAAAMVVLPLTVINQRGLGLADVMSLDVWTGASGTAVAVVILLAAGLVLVRAAQRDGLGVKRQRVAVGIGTLLAVVAPALTGHSRAFDPQAPVIALDVMHVLAGSIWFGGLVGLAITLPAIAGRGTQGVQTLARFSTVAAGVLAALVLTGSLVAWRIVLSWDNLFGTTYGWLLIIKVAIVAVAAAIAGWNRYVLLPRTRADSDHHERQSAARRMTRTIIAEASVLVVVLALTGFLVNQSPRAQAVVVAEGRTGVQTTVLGDDVKVFATMTPAKIGQNTIRVQLQDLTGEPFEPARLPVISLRSDRLDLGQLQITSVAAGTYRADVVIPTTGSWQVQVSLRLSKFDNPVGVLTFDVTS